MGLNVKIYPSPFYSRNTLFLIFNILSAFQVTSTCFVDLDAMYEEREEISIHLEYLGLEGFQTVGQDRYFPVG